MIPYFFAAGHHNYGRYITWYLRMAQNLPHNAKEDLLAGTHVCRHSDGGTTVPADQFGEQTYITYMEALFARLLVVGQQRGIELKYVFDHELSPVPPFTH